MTAEMNMENKTILIKDLNTKKSVPKWYQKTTEACKICVEIIFTHTYQQVCTKKPLSAKAQ
jgi:hypothetical protein